MNSFYVTGGLTRDPEVKTFSSGSELTTGSIATSTRYRNKDKQWVEKTDYLDFKIWGKSGEKFREKNRKGSQVFLTGSLEQDRWEDKKTGAKRSRVVLKVEEWEPMGQASVGGDRPELDPLDDTPF